MHTKFLDISRNPQTILTAIPLHLTYALPLSIPSTLHIKRPNETLSTYFISQLHILDIKVENNTKIYSDAPIRLFYNPLNLGPRISKLVQNNDIVENMRILEISSEGATDVRVEINETRAFVCNIDNNSKRVCLDIESAKFLVSDSVWVEGHMLYRPETLFEENEIIFNELTSVFEEEDRKMRNGENNGDVEVANSNGLDEKEGKLVNKDTTYFDSKGMQGPGLLNQNANDQEKVQNEELQTRSHKKESCVQEKRVRFPDKLDIKHKVKIEILEEGNGVECKNGDKVKVLYKGFLKDGTVFQEISKPFTFVVGSNSLIDGMEMGVVGMKTGEKRKIMFGPKYGYGRKKMGVIPKNSDLIFEIVMVKIIKQ